MTRLTSEHPFFEETSLYNRLRARFHPGEKLRGYFQWLREQREQGARDERKRMVAAGRSAVIRLDAPSKRVRHKLTLPQGDTLGARFLAELNLHDSADFPADGAPFRLLLVSPAALDLLRRYLQEDGSPLALEEGNEKALRQLLADDVLRANLTAARVLSAMPELEGRFNGRGFGVAEGQIAFGSDNLPPDVFPTVVYDPGAR